MLWVFRDQEWGQLAEAFRELDVLRLAVTVLIFLVSQVLLATRWWLLLRVQAIPMKVGTAVKLHLLGLFYNNVMPSATGGDLLRAWYVTKHTNRRLVAALSVFVDRAVALFSMLLMVLVVYLCLVHGRIAGAARPAAPAAHAHTVRFGLLLWILGAVVLGGLAGLCHGGIRRRMGRWARLAGGGHLASGAAAFRDSMLLYWRKPLVLLAAVALTLLLQSLTIVAFWVLGRSLGIQASVRYYFIIFPATWLLSALPVSIAGLGLLEGGLRELFTRLAAVPVEQALALALCQRFVWVAASLPGGLIHLFGAHLPKMNSFDGHPPPG